MTDDPRTDFQFIMPGKASAIVGGQFGSEAKGLAAAYIATRPLDRRAAINNLICTTNAGAQAGHTTVLGNGVSFVCYHLPTIGVLREDSSIYLNAGSIIDPTALWDECVNVSKATGESLLSLVNRITIHPNAAVIYMYHAKAEKDGLTTHLGSTQKGVGAALIDKISRKPLATAAGCPALRDRFSVGSYDLADRMHRYKTAVTVEIPQGTGLSINASEFYPYCTSRDCWVGQGLTDAGIHPSFLWHNLMVVRTFPIRVGHIYDENGKKKGDSGPWYQDSVELDWQKDFPLVTPERTTVTQRVRRIASWSDMQYEHTLRLNRPTMVLVTFMNYIRERFTDDTQYATYLNEYLDRMDRTERRTGVTPTRLFSWGPMSSEVSFSLERAKTQMELNYKAKVGR